MTHPIKAAITVGEPNWAPLELVLPACELEHFMYMGRAGEIELYKHWLTRRYLNISADGQRFYRYSVCVRPNTRLTRRGREFKGGWKCVLLPMRPV